MTDLPRAPSGEQIEIAHGDQRAVVVEVGGGLRTYSAAGRELLDGYRADEMSTSGRGQVLIPWPNRIQDGSYEFDGERHQLPIDDPAEQDAIHGLVRWAAWTVGEREPHRVVMQHLIHPQPGYPFSLAVSIEYLLSGEGLRVDDDGHERRGRACPYGCGAHPYLSGGTPAGRLGGPRRCRREPSSGPTSAASPSARSRSRARSTTSAGRRPIGGDQARQRLHRPRARRGRARSRRRSATRGRDSGLTLWVDEAYPYLMLFTGDPLPDVDRRSLAVEPMTCPPNAFRTGEALIRLEPGRSFTSTWGIDVGR